jgi:hypothetical protein
MEDHKEAGGKSTIPRLEKKLIQMNTKSAKKKKSKHKQKRKNYSGSQGKKGGFEKLMQVGRTESEGDISFQTTQNGRDKGNANKKRTEKAQTEIILNRTFCKRVVLFLKLYSIGWNKCDKI